MPNSRDLDSDNDGIPDIIEGGGSDADGDGRADSSADSDEDGLVDEYDSDSGGTAQPAPDTDSDGKPDFLDRDSDGDGLSDTIESQGSEETREPSGNDSDGDGIDDAFDRDSGGEDSSSPDTDGDGVPDFQDPDSDGDGVPDTSEAFDFDGDGIPDVLPSGTDTDGNGIDDAFDAYGSVSELNPEWRTLPWEHLCSRKNFGRKSAAVLRAVGTLKQRVENFAARARGCGGPDLSVDIASAKESSRRTATILADAFGGSTYSCPPNVCRTVSTTAAHRELSAAARVLYSSAKRTKLTAGTACKHPPPKPRTPKKGKSSEDYLKDLLAALKALPRQVTRCP